MDIAITTILIIGFVIWILGSYFNWRTTQLIRPLREHEIQPQEKWPKVSLIVPARNEANTIESAVRSKLESDYPDFEVIIVDDRSTDKTSEIVDQLAATDSRIKAVHIDKLPDGWLGKPYALKLGVDEACGDYYLFTDADVHFSNGVVWKAIAYCEEKGLGQLGVAPRLWSKRFILNIALSTFLRTYCLGGALWAIENRKAQTFTGVGAFNLVRRSAYEKTEGFEWLKCELADDVGLGKMIALAGEKTWLLNGAGDVSVEWYNRVRDIVRGLEKVSYGTIGNYNGPRAILFGLAYLFFELLPFIGLAVAAPPVLYWMCVFMIVLGFANSIWMTLWFRGPVAPSLFYPVGAMIFAWIIIRGGILGWIRGGVYWRGTFYSAEMLKKSRRVSMP